MTTLVPKTPEQARALMGQIGGVLPTGTRRAWPGLYVVCGHATGDRDPNRVEILWVHPHGKPDGARPIKPGWFYPTRPEALAFVDPGRN